RHIGRSVQEHLRRNWDDLGIIDRDVSYRSRSHYGATHEVRGAGPDRVRFRFRMVWLSSMADRRVLALPDSGRLAEEVRLSGIDCRCQTEDSRSQFREAIRHQGSGVRQPAAKIQTCAQGLREAYEQGVEEADGAAGIDRRQPVPHQRKICRVGRGTQPYASRLDPSQELTKPVAVNGGDRMNGLFARAVA